MKGYLNRPTETEETLKHGWLHTGDIARMDADGYIYIVDRKKDLIIRGGYNVYPRVIQIRQEPLPKSGTGKILKKDIKNSID
jgi:acyl-CoA synthetase (AMP-forming)/AMP-acid ligase II